MIYISQLSASLIFLQIFIRIQKSDVRLNKILKLNFIVLIRHVLLALRLSI